MPCRTCSLCNNDFYASGREQECGRCKPSESRQNSATRVGSIFQGEMKRGIVARLEQWPDNGESIDVLGQLFNLADGFMAANDPRLQPLAWYQIKNQNGVLHILKWWARSPAEYAAETSAN